jgi:hypothetical protein
LYVKKSPATAFERAVASAKPSGRALASVKYKHPFAGCPGNSYGNLVSAGKLFIDELAGTISAA